MTIELQRCGTCGAHQYPLRDICWRCLSDDLATTADAGTGRLLATSDLHRSLDEGFAARLPLRIGTVQLDAGPHLICFVDPGLAAEARVALEALPDPSGRTLWTARAISGGDASR
jgi:uncharacterized OB-fold protein